MNLNVNSQSVYYIVAASATALGLLYKVSFTIWKVVKKEVSSMKDDREKLNVVFKEVTTNHGASIKDKVNSLEKSISRNNELTEKIFFRQRWLMENQNIPIFEADKEGLCTWVNEEYAQMFGKSATFFLGNGWKNIIHPDDRKRVEEHWEHCVKDAIDSEDVFRVVADNREVIIKSIANKTADGYIGSIIKKGCNSDNCPDCKIPDICERFRKKKLSLLYEKKNSNKSTTKS
jgi:PAS domain S-box-containing protein